MKDADCEHLCVKHRGYPDDPHIHFVTGRTLFSCGNPSLIFGLDTMTRNAESKGTLSYSCKTGTLCIGRDAVLWYQMADHLVKNSVY